jgi:hypothetical protein
MKKRLLLALVLLFPPSALCAEESIPIPWTEFKALYRESIEREVMKAPREKVPLIYTLEEATYHLTISEKSAGGHVLLSGKILSGDPEPIPLFSKDMVIAGVKQVSGGSLLSDKSHTDMMYFLPDGKTGAFQVLLSFLLEPKEDSRSRFLTIAIPQALKNSLALTLPPGTRLLDEPGILDADNLYHFPTAQSLTVRFLDTKGLSTVSPVEVDMFSRIRLHGKRAVITTGFSPHQPTPASLTLKAPKGSHYVSSSLNPSWIRQLDNGLYAIQLPSHMEKPFTTQFSVESSVKDKLSFQLPVIKDNNGKEGAFVIEEPDDGQITIVGDGPLSQTPIERLATALKNLAGENRFYMHMPPDNTLNLHIKRFQPVSTPPIVLDSQDFFTSFDDNGTMLSVLVMDIPPDLGPRMKLKPLPGAEIWSLKVNGRKKTVYSGKEHEWIIPLAEGTISHVELAFLRRGENLGLRGRLETTLPETGLPARKVRVGVALPERLQLLSVEGPIGPESGESWKLPKEFMGKLHFFSRSF